MRPPPKLRSAAKPVHTRWEAPSIVRGLQSVTRPPARTLPRPSVPPATIHWAVRARVPRRRQGGTLRRLTWRLSPAREERTVWRARVIAHCARLATVATLRPICRRPAQPATSRPAASRRARAHRLASTAHRPRTTPNTPALLAHTRRVRRRVAQCARAGPPAHTLIRRSSCPARTEPTQRVASRTAPSAKRVMRARRFTALQSLSALRVTTLLQGHRRALAARWARIARSKIAT